VPPGRDFRQRARRIGIDALATPVRSPRANAVVERVIGTLRRECLDHLIALDGQHLRSVLGEFVQCYNQERPHRTLGLQTPQTRPASAHQSRLSTSFARADGNAASL
jgi:putative transposase